MANLFTIKEIDALGAALVAAYNSLQAATISASTDGYHRGKTGVPGGDWSHPSSTLLQVTADNASNLGTSATLAENVRGVLKVHFADAESHLIADTVNTGFEDGYVTDGYDHVVDLADVILLANAMKLCYNAHLTQSGVHLKDDTANTVSATDATDQSSVDTLLNEMKSKVNSHINSGPDVPRIVLL